MTLSHLEIFQRYMFTGAVSRDADGQAQLFTEDGVYEAPLDNLRLEGRAALKAGFAELHARTPAPDGALNPGASRQVVHATDDPDVFIVELDAVFDRADETSHTVSLVQIFRVRDGQIRQLRDYFKA
ncbi:nuclear transport factor 2 family protein [Dactylosporangium sp. NPDC051541]|uniref:nuclear transport factor 2 family protein n=1 Tax=Dactylosporangium sp. NPDC051541 TaxID=3363977 RepID=UPI0037AADDC0